MTFEKVIVPIGPKITSAKAISLQKAIPLMYLIKINIVATAALKPSNPTIPIEMVFLVDILIVAMQ
jgi:hypothetical protein